MNPFKFLLWEYSLTNNKWFDATEIIEWISDGGNAWLVKFKDQDHTSYVSHRNLFLYDKPKQIDYMIIEHKGTHLYKTKQCLLFGNKYKVFYESGFTSVYDATDIKIYKNELKNNLSAKGILNYYRAVVQRTAKSDEDLFLLSQFDNISNVNEESVLAIYLQGKNGKSSCPLNRPIISPFGTNYSQMKAVETTFKNRVSIIEGPPGTGKTQTILNIIANAIAKGYKIAVVSNNNSATENIYEKLKKYNFDFVCASLGNKENTETFFEHIDTTVPDLTTNEGTQSEKIGRLNYILPNLFSKENEKNKLKESKEALELEYKHFRKENENFDFDRLTFKTSKISKDKLLKALVFLNEYQKEKLSFFYRVKLRRMIKTRRKFFSFLLEDQIILLQNQYFIIQIQNIEKQIQDLNSELNTQSYKEILDEYKALSLISFKNSLNKLFEDKRINSYEKEDYKLHFNAFVEDFPVVLSSTYALAQCTKNGFLFDYLIVDEASQVNMASAILSMRVAKNMVVVGDIKQLPQIDEKGFYNSNKKLLEQYEVDTTYSYYGNSIMSSIIAVYKDSVPRALLKEHYRCNPQIIGFCNQEFYDNQLIVYTNEAKVEKPLRLVKLVEGNHARRNPDGDGGLYSEREADEILNIVTAEHPDDLGIISPYRVQVRTIESKLNSTNVEVSTIHKFQGREKKNIILSTVVNDSNDFVNDPNMINVAVSRAIDRFTLVASDKIVKGENGILADLVHYMEYHTDFSDKQVGRICSIFDILYSDYADKLDEFRKKHPSKDFDSENLVKALILEILSDKKHNHLKMSSHVPLKEILKEKFIKMTPEEYAFYKNPWSHADFVIYNRFSHKPYAIIEVDGVEFHEQQEKQVQRDALKDSIINKSGIRFIRLKTNESNEKQRVINLLS